MKKSNLLWGLLFILAAVLIMVNQIGFLPELNMFDIIITIIMSGIILVSIRKLNFWGILFPLAFIGMVYEDQLNIAHLTPWTLLLIAFLLSLGLSLVFSKHTGMYMHFFSKDRFRESVVNEQDSNVVNCSTSFGEIIKYVNSENFERANIKCSFGEVKVYFDNANIPSGKADIYLDVSFGEVKLYIPRIWNVVNHVHTSFGDMEVTQNYQPDAPTVTIHGNVSFGDATVIYV